MTARARMGWAAAVCLAVLTFALGVAARPLLISDSPSPPQFSADEIGFLQDMSAHHQQALLMTTRLPPSADASVRTLATQIDDTQRTEIGTMQGWLTLAGALPTNPHPMAWMRSTHEHHETPAATMPGMASTDELDALAAAAGDQADRQFLTLMRRHHSGGVLMAQAAAAQLPDGPVRRMARGMFTDQTRETAVMTLLLERDGAQPR
ncbi:uncharacterized protein (DUF305 family) [Nocardia transvalensis]|uniref:Uncharacterized protein (DUF305 family) n=1 Tax=Nocardia transvalensis TaxID=37333 RepID=A0A7W9PGP2_9NOCA|nr:DUF305 domain-containing protein [Nocardia transvalensis]MBB5915343.1 uncharacterized protein (DUF305 family) [Nocardia transvalensis]